MTPTVLHLSTYGADGGAARAAAALHEGMVHEGVNSTLRTATGPRFKMARAADRQLWRLQHSPVATWRSPARFGALSAQEINSSSAEVVNLHWVTDGFLTIEQIGRITKPIVWSMYDMWPFTGTEHYGIDTPDARWRDGYNRDNRPQGETGWDIDRHAWNRKERNWSPMQMVPASTWLADAVAASALMRSWPVKRIPHVVNDSIFAPMPPSTARLRLGLDPAVPYVVFLASAGIADSRKGFDLLASALPALREAVPAVELLVVGPADPLRSDVAGVPVSWLGSVSGNVALRDAYCSGAVVAVPSREDNMPLTAMEAQTCGRPVVAFDIGGLPDILSHQETGHIAPPFDTDDFARGLIAAVEDSLGGDAWGRQARERALALWSPSAVVPQYLDLYNAVVA